MNKKSLIAIILLLLFVIAVILFNQKDKKDEAFVELEAKLKQVEKELTQMEEENTGLEDKVDSLVEENVDLKWERSTISSENDRLTANLLDMSISSAIVTNADVSGGLLNLDMFYVTHDDNQLVQAEEEFTKQITKDVPIFMLNERSNYSIEDWDYMVNLDRTPLLDIFEDNSGRPIFIREAERDHDYDIEEW